MKLIFYVKLENDSGITFTNKDPFSNLKKIYLEDNIAYPVRDLSLLF